METPTLLFTQYASWAGSSALATLAGMAQTEDWEYRNVADPRPLPILRNYVAYSFRRAQFQGRIAEAESRDGQTVRAFNTGLLTNHFEPIFGYFVPQSSLSFPQPWFLQGFYRESDYRLMAFQQLPQRATYFGEPADLLYNPNYSLRVQYDHIVNDNLDRFPEPLRANEPRRTETVRLAIKQAEFRVNQNYKTAIPQFYWPSRDATDPGRIQLLLPLCLENSAKADLALSVDKEGAVYRAATVLTLDMAYNNARLVARPDREWLEPIPQDNGIISDDGEHAAEVIE